MIAAAADVGCRPEVVVARSTCRSCKALLPKRGARCRSCGWASDYGTNRQERELRLGIGLLVLAVCMALVVSIVLAYALREPL